MGRDSEGRLGEEEVEWAISRFLAEPRNDIFAGSWDDIFWVGRRLVEDGDDIAGGVPELVGEVAAGPNLGLAETAVVAGGGADGEGEAEGVGAVLVDDFEGIEYVALHLTHLLAVFVLDEAVEIYSVEGYVAHVLDAEHDHAGDPEE